MCPSVINHKKVFGGTFLNISSKSLHGLSEIRLRSPVWYKRISNKSFEKSRDTSYLRDTLAMRNSLPQIKKRSGQDVVETAFGITPSFFGALLWRRVKNTLSKCLVPKICNFQILKSNVFSSFVSTSVPLLYFTPSHFKLDRGKERARERERVRVCVCVDQRERDRVPKNLKPSIFKLLHM